MKTIKNIVENIKIEEVVDDTGRVIERRVVNIERVKRKEIVKRTAARRKEYLLRLKKIQELQRRKIALDLLIEQEKEQFKKDFEGQDAKN